MAQINVSLWLDNEQLGPGESRTWWEEPVSLAAVRWYTAVPINPVIDGFIDRDQVVKITEVYHILKGINHQRDGTGGAQDVQVNVTVQNMDPVNRVTFRVYKAEVGFP